MAAPYLPCSRGFHKGTPKEDIPLWVSLPLLDVASQQSNGTAGVVDEKGIHVAYDGTNLQRNVDVADIYINAKVIQYVGDYDSDQHQVALWQFKGTFRFQGFQIQHLLLK
jgi:hypothetical protein